MKIRPTSSVTLYKGALEGGGQLLAFSSAAKREQYFSSLDRLTVTNLTVVEKTGRIQLQLSMGTVGQYDYMSFTNPVAMDGRTFYAYISDYNYVTNETTEITYVIDLFMTWLFDFRMEVCPWERAHLSQADQEKALANPYRIDIPALYTEEPIFSGESTEKEFYVLARYGDQEPVDGVEYPSFAVNTTAADAQYYEIGQHFASVMFLAPIDFEDLDSGVDPTTPASKKPSGVWNALINDITNAGGKYIAIDDQETSMGSVMARGYDIIMIAEVVFTGAALLKRLIDFLTKYFAISQVVGLFSMPIEMFNAASGYLAFSGYQVIGDYFTEDETKRLHNPKLYRFPYRYLKIVTPDGNTKEMKYELFRGIALDNGQGMGTIVMQTDLNGKPSVMFVPNNYKEAVNYYGSAGVYTNPNFDEMVVFDQFPQIPFVTDAYLTYLSGQANNWWAGNTLARQQNVVEGAKVIGGGVTQHIKTRNRAATMRQRNEMGLTNYSDAAIGFNQLVDNAESLAATWTGAVFGTILDPEDKAEVSEGSMKWLAGQTDDGIMYYEFGGVRPAYANNEYHPGTNGGVYNYQKGAIGLNFKIIHAKSTKAIEQANDKYLDLYGLNHNGIIIDVPYVYNFIHGSTDKTKIPHWAEVDGLQVTYIKTRKCHVNGVPDPVRRALETLFEGGVRFVNGDALIEGGGSNGS